MEAKALVATLADTVAEAEANKICDTLGDVMAEAVIYMMADTLPEDMNKTFGHTLVYMKAEQRIDALRNSRIGVDPST